MNIPIIRLELEGMKHSLLTALMEHQVKLDSDIQNAINNYLTESNIKRVIDECVMRTLDSVLKEEVEKFFKYGEGRKVIAEGVKEKLLARETFTPLDEV